MVYGNLFAIGEGSLQFILSELCRFGFAAAKIVILSSGEAGAKDLTTANAIVAATGTRSAARSVVALAYYRCRQSLLYGPSRRLCRRSG
jgi:hypothetical protein